MGKQTGSRKLGNNKRSPSMATYPVRFERNKKRRIAKEKKVQSERSSARAAFDAGHLIHDINRVVRTRKRLGLA